jgi:hypothetical protein
MSDFFYDDEEAAEQRAHGIHGDEEDYGACPRCGGAGEMVAQGRRHWAVCHRDRVKWRVGTGLFGWFLRGKTDRWDCVGDWLGEYEEVAPDKTPLGQDVSQGESESKSASTSDAETERLKRMFE